MDECVRLGFLKKDDNETLFLSPVGTGYLLDVGMNGVETPHEAYAAGFEQGYRQAKDDDQDMG